MTAPTSSPPALPAGDRYPASLGFSRIYEMPRDIDKVIEGIAAILKLSLQVPAVAEFITSSHVRDRKAKSSIKQGDA